MAEIENKPTTKRRPGNPAWRKGVSGNPGGRPKIEGHVRELARQHTELAIRTLAEIAGNPREPSRARVAAAEALLDRAWGRPAQLVGSDPEHPLPAGGLSEADRAALMAFIGLVQERLKAGGDT